MNPNSMLFWFPKIENLEIPVPKTEIVSGYVDLMQAAERIGYPVFIRTDLCAGKHDWKNSCFVQNEDQLVGNMQSVISANVRWEMLGIKYRSLVVREFLDLETSFTAFSGDMPINKERRYFVRDGKVICHHPYWPEDTFNQHPARMANDPDWQAKLAALNDETGEEILHEYARKASQALPGYWSVDFAKAKNGAWYLLDAALGENSYHWPSCTENGL